MPPKHKYSKEQIVDAAFEIACKEGVSGLTIRKIADRLGSSVAPVYVNFADAEELRRAVVARTARASMEILAETHTGEPLRDIGVASLRMASEYSVLVRDLMFSQNGYLELYSEMADPGIVERMSRDPILEGRSEREIHTLLLKLRIVQIGMSVAVANGVLPVGYSETDSIALQDELMRDVIAGADG
ncbi:MAG: TetR/AcrR family transcriptional regulator [Alkalispirochaeta sp.]